MEANVRIPSRLQTKTNEQMTCCHEIFDSPQELQKMNVCLTLTQLDRNRMKIIDFLCSRLSLPECGKTVKCQKGPGCG